MADRRLFWLTGALTMAWAVAMGSALFSVAAWIGGDIAYHRGVAYTMAGANWQGEGPYAGLLTYYGGTYPLVISMIADAAGVVFDTAASIVSWGIALAWPVLFWWLGTRIWPGFPLRAALFALLATTAAPWTNRVLLWVDSPLVAAQNAFPLYPRDLALMLLVVLAGAALSGRARVRVLGAGIAIGLMVTVHLQISLVAGWLVIAAALAKVAVRRDPRPLGEAVAAGVLAVVISAWWWIPRAVATVQSGGLLLGGFPGAAPLRLDLGNALMTFGIVGLLAVFGLALAAARRPLPGRLRVFAAWGLALLPLVAVDRLLGGSDFLSERRTWLIMSIPLTALAAATASLIVGRLRPIAAAGFIVVVLVGASVPGTIATLRVIRDAWDPGRIGGRIFDTTAWDPLLADLHRRLRADGVHVTVTYDAYGAWVWSLSGSQVASLWLPGPFKLGFDPERLTGVGYLDRVRAEEAAFTAGRDGICMLAARFEAASIVLDVQDGLVGTLDSSVASPYRVDPRDRDENSIERPIANGIVYLDKGGKDVLWLGAGATWSPPFRSATARLLAVEINVPLPPPGAPLAPTVAPLVDISTGTGSVAFGQGLMPGPARVVVPVDGIGDGVVVTARNDVELVRVTAFEPLADLALPVADGPVRLAPAELCDAR